jgi:hypothetical protein
MSKKIPKDPFQALSATDLAIVNGGRLIPNKGPDAVVVQGLELLVKTIAEVGQSLATNGQAQSQQMMQMMQQMMEKRRAGG